MMGLDNNEEEAHLYASREDMESLGLDEDGGVVDGNSKLSTSKSYANYRSAMSNLSSSFASSTADSSHPLFSPAPADSDPLLSPCSPPSVKFPRSSSSSPKNSSNTANSYSEPLSYADVIFSPLDDAIEANGVDSPSKDDSEKPISMSDSLSSSSDFLDIRVSDPLKEVENSSSIVPGSNYFVSYLITTKTNISDYEGSEFSVRRRFKDVVTLSDRLTEAYRGFFIPPRPDKSLVESQVMQKQEFVELRRLALEKYLRRLAQHPVFKKSDELRVFLQVQGKLPLPTNVDVTSRMLDGAVKLPKQLFSNAGSMLGPQDVVQPAKGGRDLLRMFKELKQSVVNDWGGSRPAVEEEDKEFLEKKETLHALEQQLTSASKQVELLVKAQQDMGETMGELGLAFIRLTKFENENAMLNTQRVRASDMKTVATAAVKASRFYRGLNAQTVKHLDTVHDHMGLMLAVNHAFSDRSSALLTVQTLLSELSALHLKAEKLESSRNTKWEELKDAIRVNEDAKSCAIREYERIKENNKSEIERLDQERRADFVNMLKGFVTSQVSYMEKIENEWAKAAEETVKYTNETL